LKAHEESKERATMPVLRRIAARLPIRWQTELRRLNFSRLIKSDRFVSPEPEFRILDSLIKPGDWVVDVGANVGHYTKRFSELVGARGRVIAFEPVPTTFALLSANVQLFKHLNVTLINAAVSDRLGVIGMSLPRFDWGTTNFYEARISPEQDSSLSVLMMSFDALCLTQRIALIKIDAEGHESFVLAGMQNLVKTSRPVLIVETSSKEVIAGLSSLGYTSERLPDSPNLLFRPKT